MNNILLQLIDKWKSLLSIYDDAEDPSWMSGIRDLNKRISLAMSLDETGVTTAMILRDSLKDYLSNKSFSFSEIAGDERDKLFNFIKLYDEMIALLNDGDIRTSIQNFEDKITQSLTKNNITIDDEFAQILSDENLVAQIRLSALNANKKLRIDQFAKGESKVQSTINISDSILGFSDINILLRVMKSGKIKDGAYLCIIHDNEDYRFSFFVFAIKNGENIWVTSDKPELPQPNYRHMGRGRAIDRHFENRVTSYLFPYELLVEYDENAERFIKIKTKGEYFTALAEYEMHWKIEGTLKDCDPESRLWIFFMLSLYQQRFFISNNPPMLKGLSGTNAMITKVFESNSSNTALTFAGKNALSTEYNVIPMNTSTSTPNSETEDSIERSVGINAWLEERYAEKIPDFHISDLVSAPDETIRLLPVDNKILNNEEPDELDWKDPHYNVYGRDTRIAGVGDMRMSDFGTFDELEKTAKFQARYARAKIIQVLANEEYLARKQELVDWYVGKLENRMDVLERAIGRGEFVTVVHRNLAGFYYGESDEVRKNVLRISIDKKGIDIGYIWRIKLHGGVNKYDKHNCYFTGQQASVFAYFDINNADAIAEICGCAREDLPDVLQHFTKAEPYAGNSILDNVDPLDHIKNPFNENMKFEFVVAVSKRYYNSLVKKWRTQDE